MMCFRPHGSLDVPDTFNSQRCFQDRSPAYPFQNRKWVLELNPWESHAMVTVIAAIILRDYLGYSVEIRSIEDPAVSQEVYRRTADAGDTRYGNLEVWGAGKEAAYNEYVLEQELVVDAGSVGYTGRNGIFLSKHFSTRPGFDIPIEFYSAFNTNFSFGRSVIG